MRIGKSGNESNDLEEKRTHRNPFNSRCKSARILPVFDHREKCRSGKSVKNKKEKKRRGGSEGGGKGREREGRTGRDSNRRLLARVGHSDIVGE